MTVAMLSFAACAIAADESAEDPSPAVVATIPLDATQPPVAVPDDDATGIGEIVVTAQKREERLRDVPISIQAYGGEDLAARGIESTRQLERLVPSLQFAAIASFPLVFIRGLGTDNFVPSADPSIATYIDGIYVPNGAGAVQSLSHIRRVEVLKGPQGTLFGRNATGGAISVITDDPGAALEASASVELGRFNARTIEAGVSGPLTSWLSASLSGETQRAAPYYSNLYYEVPEEQLDALRLKLALRPSEHLLLALSGYRSEQAGLFQMIYQNVEPSALGTAFGMQPQRDDFVGEVDFPGIAEATQEVLSGVATWNLPSVDLKVLASDQRHDAQGQIDFDGSPVPAAGLSTESAFTDLQTLELQLLSTDQTWGAQRLTWVAGLYALRSSAGLDPAVVRSSPGFTSGVLAMSGDPAVTQLGDNLEALFGAFGLGATPLGDGGLSLIGRGVLDTRSYSAYVQGTIHFTEWLDLTLGGRVQREKRFLSKAQTDLSDFSGEGGTTVLPFDLQQARASNFAPKAVLSLKPSDGAMVFLSYSVAYKSGTYNVVNTYLPPNYLVPEKVYSFEVGTKLEWLDGAVRLDAAVFDSHIRNLQSGFTSLLSGGIVQFFSVPRARTRGAETNLSWVPMPQSNPGLSLAANAAYVDAIYQEFPNGPGFDDTTGVYSGDFDHSGNRLTYTPRRSANLSVVQALQTARGRWEIAADESWTDKVFSNAQNSQAHGAYALFNARIGYTYTPWGATLTVFGQNLFDRRHHVLVGQNDFGRLKTLAAPREVGIRLSWVF